MEDGMETGERMMKAKKARPMALDLCCGAGGFAIALQAGGYRHLGYDSWQPAIDTHLANGMDAKLADVMTMDWSAWTGKVEVIVGGPPCQPFSAAGDGRGEWDERDCIPGFIRAVREVQPQWFIMENVRGLTFKKHREYLGRVIDGLREAGYRVEWRVLHAEEYGVPQTRQRLIVIGVRNSTKRMPRWPTPTHRKYKHRVAREGGDQSLLPWVSMADALGWDEDEVVCRSNYGTGGDPRARGERRLDEPAATVTSKIDRFKWVSNRPSTTIVGSFRPDIVAAPGYRKKGDTPRQNAPGSVKVSEEEAARLQSFPNGFTFTGNSGTIYKQIGNAIPPLLALAVIEANK